MVWEWAAKIWVCRIRNLPNDLGQTGVQGGMGMQQGGMGMPQQQMGMGTLSLSNSFSFF